MSALYASVMVWVWCGIAFGGGENYLSYAILHIAGFVLVFVASILMPLTNIEVQLTNLVSRFSLTSGSSKRILAFSLLVVSSLLAIAHWLHMGTIPIIAATRLEDVSAIAKVRSDIEVWTRFPYSYVPTIVIKATIPVLAIYYLAKKQHLLLWAVVAIGLAYALSLMQRSYPLFILLPLGLYAFAGKRYVTGVAAAAISGLSLLALMVVTNPSMRVVVPHLPEMRQSPSDTREIAQNSNIVETGSGVAVEALPGSAAIPSASVAPPAAQPVNPASAPLAVVKDIESEMSKLDALQGIVGGIQQRVLYKPGAIAVRWFKTFPDVYPYQRGCGYRFIAPFAGCEFVALPTLLYAHYYPRYVANGVKGSMNAAHFVMEYANFGPVGLAAAGALAGIVLLGVAVVLAGLELKAFMVLNLPFIIALGSTSLHTTLLSGGWLLIVLLSLLLLEGRPSRATLKAKTETEFAVRLSRR